MRFAFWRKGKEEAQAEVQAEAPTAKPAPAPAKVVAAAPSGDIDLHAIGASACASSLPLRQNAKRIALSRERHDST